MKIEITKKVYENLISCLERAKKREIGGVLMAEQLEPGNFRIIGLSIDDSTGNRSQFTRSPEQHRAVLEAFFSETGSEYGKYNYLGEWHSHPNHAPTPSDKDIQSMVDILNEEPSISFAILLIVQLDKWMKIKFTATLFCKGLNPSCVKVSIEE